MKRILCPRGMLCPRGVLCLLVALCLLGGACLADEYDLPRVYPRSEAGEAIIDDVTFHDGWDVDDNNRVFYEIFVGSFSDADGDGIGDLRGVINRLDYLNDGDPTSGQSLGVEGIWLTPVFASPSYHKYDVTDYYAIDPEFGTMDDLRELIDGCHERGIKLILDLPINHTGSQNRWYRNFVNAHRFQNPDNIYYDFYVWQTADGPVPAGRHFMNVSGLDLRVEANFSDDMPEPDFDNPMVREAFLDVARYYLEMGVDGFRFDAAKYIYFGDHAACVDFWEWYIGELKKVKPDIYTVAEVWDSDGITDLYVPATNCFNFTLSQANGLIAETAKAGNVNRLTGYLGRYIDDLRARNDDAFPVLFIANHDTDRAAGFLTVASGQMKMAANLYLLAPGSPFIYYGEEIGLRGSRGGSTTDANRRLAMLWGDGDPVADPTGANYASDKQTPYTVADLYPLGDGLYNYYKRLLMIRRANPEIARGAYTPLTLEDSKMGGFICAWNGNSVAVLHNTTQRDMSVDLAEITDIPFGEISASIGAGEARLEGSTLRLEAQTSVVLR